jgi:hypothetical protein
MKNLKKKLTIGLLLASKPKASFNLISEYLRLKKASDNRFSFRLADLYPCLDEVTVETDFDAHYVYHPAWAARIIAQLQPAKHIDIASTVYFSSMISAFIPTEFYDYRPARLNLSNLKSDRGDLAKLDFADNSIESLSCMHTIEHIGLGRYGDELDISGDLKALAELKRVTAINGSLLIVVPIGKVSRIHFNAHRIYTYKQFLNYFPGFDLLNFALVTDQSSFIAEATESDANDQFYGCGCFWFKKRNI